MEKVKAGDDRTLNDHIKAALLSDPLFWSSDEGGSLTFSSIHCRDRVAVAHSRALCSNANKAKG